MASVPKLTLSDKELSFVTDPQIILTKLDIIQKVYDLFASSVSLIDQQILQRCALPGNVKASIPKIYKGENYLQLPYVILDYPRCFEKENVFALRTMFWWGNFFSVTLHISGGYKNLLKPGWQETNLPGDLYIGVNADQWQHHFERDNYILYKELEPMQKMHALNETEFIKLAFKLDLMKWNEMPALLSMTYKKIAGMLC